MKKLLLILAVTFCLDGNAQIITTVAGNGTYGYSGDGAAATAAEFKGPTGVAFDAAGNMYIADQNSYRVRKVNTAGIISTFAGNGTFGFSGDGGLATNAEISSPFRVASDSKGNIYIVDYNNLRIRKVNSNGIITTFAGNGTNGYTGDGGLATNAGIFPEGIAVDNISGNIYIADFGNYVIRKVDTGGIITTFAGNGNNGFSGDGGPAVNAEMASPQGVATDIYGNVYISDPSNHIRKVNTNGIINTIAGGGSCGGGSTDCGDGGLATNAFVYTPEGLTVDALGNVYISMDQSNDIRKVNTGDTITRVVGDTIAGYAGDGGLAINAELNHPIDVAFDALGNLYIADEGNSVIRKVCFNSCAAAGIQRYTNNNEQVNIYPNPTNGNFTIETQNTEYNVHCILYDVNGKQVLTQTINGKTTIDSSNLSEGIYNISIISNEGVINKRVVIVR